MQFGGGRLLLAKGNQGAFSESNRSLPLFCVGGEASACELSLSGGEASVRGNQGPFSECNRTLPLFCSVGGGGFCSRGEETAYDARTRTQQSTFLFHFQGASCQHLQFQHSLTAAIWTLIRQHLPATTLKMRLLSLLLLAHRLLLMTITFKLCPPCRRQRQ